MHKPYPITFDRDIRQRRSDPPQWRRFTVFVSARNAGNAIRRCYKRYPGCRLVPDCEV